MHITHRSTPDALPELIRQIKARDYRIVSLRQALGGADLSRRRYQQTCPQLSYLGNWYYSASASQSGGSTYSAVNKGAAVLASFTGTSFELIATKGPDRGKVMVSIDDGPAMQIDLYSSSAKYRWCVLRLTGLTDTTHTASIWAAHTKNSASRGYYIDVDAIRTSGKLVQAPRPTRYQEDDTLFSYQGSWTSAPASPASGGEFTHSDLTDAAVNITFNGTYLAWIGKKGPDRGKALVSLDGGAPVVVDLYQGSHKCKVRVYETGLLEKGPHTLSICVLGDKRAASSSCRVDVDAFDFLGTPSQA